MAVLVGSPGFLGNLELPLSYTIVGMPAALIVWTLVERERRAWHAPAIVALTLIAVGFKEQGLVIAPVVIAAWWMCAPGAGRGTAAAVAAVAASYVVFRLAYHDRSMPLFEQDVGFGFSALSPGDAEARFGCFLCGSMRTTPPARPRAPLFGEPSPASLAEAVTRRFGVEHAYAFIRAGQDPNEPIVVDDPDYTGGRAIRVSPLMLAVAARDSNVVMMLLNFGARLDLPQNRLALAQDLGDDDIASIIAREGGLHGSACPERGAGATMPLLAWR